MARPGFDRLLAAICRKEVGLILSVEASRLARNGRDWHTLLEYCGLVGCLVSDGDGIYDPRVANDRLFLGMRGTLFEMEHSMLRDRCLEALRQKAQRGDLFTTVAVGYVRVGRDRIEMHPDQRVRDAIRLVFARFAVFQSIRQTHLWLRQEGIRVPTMCFGPAERQIVRKTPIYRRVHSILTNPVYAGAHVFGRTGM